MGLRGKLPSDASKRARLGQGPCGTDFTKFRETGDVVPPDRVRQSPDALAFWEKHAPTLIESGRLVATGVDGFATCCLIHADIIRLEGVVQAQGVTVTTARGTSPNPMCGLLLRYRTEFGRWLENFGMTPKGAARLPAPARDNSLDRDNALLRTFTG